MKRNAQWENIGQTAAHLPVDSTQPGTAACSGTSSIHLLYRHHILTTNQILPILIICLSSYRKLSLSNFLIQSIQTPMLVDICQWLPTFFAPCTIIVICQNVIALSNIFRLKRYIPNNMEHYAISKILLFTIQVPCRLPPLCAVWGFDILGD